MAPAPFGAAVQATPGAVASNVLANALQPGASIWIGSFQLAMGSFFN